MEVCKIQGGPSILLLLEIPYKAPRFHQRVTGGPEKHVSMNCYNRTLYQSILFKLKSADKGLAMMCGAQPRMQKNVAYVTGFVIDHDKRQQAQVGTSTHNRDVLQRTLGF